MFWVDIGYTNESGDIMARIAIEKNIAFDDEKSFFVSLWIMERIVQESELKRQKHL